METNELKITIPKGQEINWEESAKQKKIILKKKDNKPRSWKEYCCTRLDTKETRFGYRIGNACDAVTVDWDNVWNYSTYKDVLPSKELVEVFLAMMQLMSLRYDWIHKWSIENGMTNDWQPNWNNNNQQKVNIICQNNEFTIIYFNDLISRPLSFPTKEIAEDFINCFKDLLEIAKPLI